MPYSDWFANAILSIKGEDVERIKSNLFKIGVPLKENKQFTFSIVAPQLKKEDLKSWRQTVGRPFGLTQKAHASGLRPDKIVAQSKKRLSAIFSYHPVVVIESLVPAGYKHD